MTPGLDTSVIGGCFDDEWKAATQELFRQAGLGLYRLAGLGGDGARGAVRAAEVQQHFASTFTDAAQIHEPTAEAESLAQAYLAAGVVTPKYADDARHVAIATVHGLAVIVSWNFRHLANLRREAGFNAVTCCRVIPKSVSCPRWS